MTVKIKPVHIYIDIHPDKNGLNFITYLRTKNSELIALAKMGQNFKFLTLCQNIRLHVT